MACLLAGTMEDPAWHGDMAKQYPFTLDPFQSTAVACLVRCILFVHMQLHELWSELPTQHTCWMFPKRCWCSCSWLSCGSACTATCRENLLPSWELCRLLLCRSAAASSMRRTPPAMLCPAAGTEGVCPGFCPHVCREDSCCRVGAISSLAAPQLCLTALRPTPSLHAVQCACRYAIAMAFRDKQKVIYTSPLKVSCARNVPDAL